MATIDDIRHFLHYYAKINDKVVNDEKIQAYYQELKGFDVVVVREGFRIAALNNKIGTRHIKDIPHYGDVMDACNQQVKNEPAQKHEQNDDTPWIDHKFCKFCVLVTETVKNTSERYQLLNDYHSSLRQTFNSALHKDFARNKRIDEGFGIKECDEA